MGLIPARAWDTEGVTTLRALNTPFLVTTDALVNEIVSDEDLAGELMSGLDAAGVVGLALVPEGLRHPFAFGDPLLGPDDYQGAVMRAPTSATTAAMFEALGATINDDEPRPVDPHRRGIVVSARSAGHGDGQRDVLSEGQLVGDQRGRVGGADARINRRSSPSAAADTRDWAIDHIPSDHDAAVERCANGFAIVLASDDDLAGLAEATAPVVAELREDPATAELIDEITAPRVRPPPTAKCRPRVRFSARVAYTSAVKPS